MTPSPSRGKGYQNPDCEHREGCLDVAAFGDWPSFHCEKCELAPVDMQAVKTRPIKQARPKAKRPPRAGKTREAPHADPGEDPLRYKWKFMQRDPSYLTAWRRWKVFSSFSPEPAPEDLPTINYHLAEPFGLLHLIDPETDYGPEVKLGFLLGKCLGEESVTSRRFLDKFPEDEEPETFRIIARQVAGKYAVLINFDKISSLGQFQKEVSAEVDRLWRLNHRGRGAYKKDFDRVLQAGDLSRKGVSFDDIAKELFPTAGSAEQWESGTTKTRQYLKTYERYCAGAWREL